MNPLNAYNAHLGHLSVCIKRTKMEIGRVNAQFLELKARYFDLTHLWKGKSISLHIVGNEIQTNTLQLVRLERHLKYLEKQKKNLQNTYPALQYGRKIVKH